MRTFTALVNPISGGGHASELWEPVAALLRAAGAELTIERTQSRDHAVKLATDAAARGDVVIAVGGDGLVRDAAGGVVAGTEGDATSTGALGIVPAGRGNDLAHTLGIPDDPETLAKLLLEAIPRRIDVLDVNGVIAPGNVYVGIDSLATQIINANRWMPALLLYRLAPVKAILSWRPPVYSLTTAGNTREARAHTVVIANSGAYGHGLRIVPSAVLDDGLADVMIVGAGPRRQVVEFMRQAQHGTHVSRPEVELTTTREIVIDADRPVPVCADGDEVTSLPATIRVRNGALRVLAPA